MGQQLACCGGDRGPREAEKLQPSPSFSEMHAAAHHPAQSRPAAKSAPPRPGGVAAMAARWESGQAAPVPAAATSAPRQSPPQLPPRQAPAPSRAPQPRAAAPVPAARPAAAPPRRATVAARPSGGGSGPVTGKAGLLMWAQGACAPYGVEVRNFSTSWKDGRAFCALLAAYDASLLDFSRIRAENAEANLNLAFDTAKSKLGVTRLLDAEDIVGMPRPDDKSIMLYVSTLHRRLSQPR